jgi:hypothetical protein
MLMALLLTNTIGSCLFLAVLVKKSLMGVGQASASIQTVNGVVAGGVDIKNLSTQLNLT